MVASCPASLMDQTQSRSSKPSRRPFWLAFVAMTPACAPPPPVPDKPEPALAIRVGTSGDYAPFSTRQDDERRGFDIEIALGLPGDTAHHHVERVLLHSGPELEIGRASCRERVFITV